MSAPAPRRNVMLWGGIAVGVIAVAAVALALTNGGSGAGADPIPITPPTVASSDSQDDTQPPVDTSAADDRPLDPVPQPVAPPPPPPPTPPPPAAIRFASAAALDAVLLRLNDRLLGVTEPSAGELPAIQDTLMAALDQALTIEHRRAAATQLAVVASYRNDPAACRRWAGEVDRLGGEGARLRGLCGGQEP